MRVTRQRQVLLDELCKLHTHPTADELYQLARKKLPRISLGTVYRNLELMAEQGLIRKLEAGGTQKRFDGKVVHHYHVRCLNCDRLDDLPNLPIDTELECQAKQHTDFTILRHNLEFTGLCPACR
ncbi:MAG: transcriptional repressor [Desulfobulbaceae bacterium]|nr:MAG: transcriptional repressor [Desulfobulbaceae bacterium]